MKISRYTKDGGKILLTYFLSTVICFFIENLVIEYDYIPDKDHLYSLIVFTLAFLFLLKLFNVNFKSILIFLGIIMFLLIFILLNLDFYITVSTPNEVCPLMFLIALYTTLPFQLIIHTLHGFSIGEASYFVVPIYMIVLTFIYYVLVNLKINQKSNQ